jgi:hypothetical protein
MLKSAVDHLIANVIPAARDYTGPERGLCNCELRSDQVPSSVRDSKSGSGNADPAHLAPAQ